VSDDRIDQYSRSLIDSTWDCISLIATDGTILDINRPGLQLFEAENAAAVEGRSLFELVASEYRGPYRAIHERACRGEPGTFETEIASVRGDQAWIELRTVPLERSSSDSPAYFAIARDISGRKRMAELLRSSTEFGIVTIDERQHVVVFNAAAERFFGCSASEILGQTIDRLIPVRFRQGHAEGAAILRDGDPHDGEVSRDQRPSSGRPGDSAPGRTFANNDRRASILHCDTPRSQR